MRFKVGDRVVIDAPDSRYFHGRLASVAQCDLSDNTYYIKFDGPDEFIWVQEAVLRPYLNGVQAMMECL